MFYAIGDVHGEASAFRTLLEQINDRAADDPEAVLVQVGDVIDRGPDSQEVVRMIERLRSLIPNVNKAVVLRGNHENSLELILRDSYPDPQHWYRMEHGRNGGRATLCSYGIDPGESPADDDIVEAAQAVVPDLHRELLYTLPYIYQGGDYVFVHAGIDPARPLHEQKPRELISIRDRFFEREAQLDDTVVVHGHTPDPNGYTGPNRVNVDTGAGYGLKLSCFVLPFRYEPDEVETIGVKTEQPNRWLESDEYEAKTGHIDPPYGDVIPEPITIN